MYAMHISEIMSYDAYWRDERFRSKRPYLQGSLKQAYGDNIYYRDAATRRWVQADSHHSLVGGETNVANLEHDTGSDNVLIAEEFYYFGGSARAIPGRFRDWNGYSICKKGPSHKCTFPDELIEAFVAWVRGLGSCGCVGEPAQFREYRAG